MGVVNKTAAFSVGRGPFFGLIRPGAGEVHFPKAFKVPFSFEFSHQKCQNRLVKVRFMCEQHCVFSRERSVLKIKCTWRETFEREIYCISTRDAFFSA